MRQEVNEEHIDGDISESDLSKTLPWQMYFYVLDKDISLIGSKLTHMFIFLFHYFCFCKLINVYQFRLILEILYACGIYTENRK